MYHGAGLQRVYEKYGENKKTVIYLDANIRLTDTKAIILAAYKQESNVEPTFPIILASQGGRQLANLFEQPGLGGPTWIVMPDRSYTYTSYVEAELTKNIDKALATTGIQKSLLNQTFYTRFTNNSLTLCSPIQDNVVVQMVSLNGKTVFHWQGTVSNGITVLNLNISGLADNYYIVNVLKGNQILFKNELLMK